MKEVKCLRLILGDQLDREHSWFWSTDPSVCYVLMETRSETDYVLHHIQKVVGFFAAMRAFAEWLRECGHQVDYLRLDEERNRQSVPDNLRYLAQHYGVERIEYQLPDEYRLDRQLAELAGDLPIPVVAVDSEHFLTTREELARLFQGKKTYLMETFYRHMRRKWSIMMEADGETPLSGRWNYDEENRKALPAGQLIPEMPSFTREVGDLVDLLGRCGVKTFGKINPAGFTWPIQPEEARQLLRHFLQHRLRHFGRYQDALSGRDPWLFHSRLSFALNTKMIRPLEVVNACVGYAQAHPGEVDIAQLEGFVRQIIGWREYMRGVYWARMPEYAGLNYFQHQAALPGWYWTGQTRMACLRHAIGQSLEHAYAHHIQRLMVTGNFALLLGVHPDELDAWYLGIYQDALEWVEITNTRGMSQFADGGIVGTKPYVSSANYIDKMSDYCKGCYYDAKDKTGPRSCPFNSLYWDFYDRHRSLLANNPRIGMMYRTWDRMDPAQKERLLLRAQEVKKQVEEL